MWAQRLRRSIKLSLEKRRLWTAMGWSAFPFLVHEWRATGELFECRLGGERFWVRAGTTDFVVAWSNLCGNEFELVPNNLNIEDSSVIIDAGAYIGTSSLVLSKIFPGVKVLALEPHPGNFEVLKLNTQAKEFITPLNTALADTMGVAQLRDKGQGEYGYTTIDDSGAISREWIVPTVSVASLLEDYDFERVLLLKLDIEGAEVDVLSRGADALTKVDCLVAELHDFLDSRCMEAFITATKEMVVVGIGGEKSIAVRETAMRTSPSEA